MAKKAFVIGANSTKLDYAESDAKKISRALSNLGYEVDGLATSMEKKNDVVQRFEEFAATCKTPDTLIFYFAGHGIFQNNTGTLYLVLNSSDLSDITRTAIRLSSITEIFQKVVIAQNRFIILDCCEAGGESLVFNNVENYQVLRATETWQRASEFDELKAGFLSYHLHQLLTEPARHLLNNRHQLTITALEGELHNRVIAHNQRYPEKEKRVPNFVVVGKRNSDYEIATLTPQYAGLLAITPQFIEQERNKNSSNPHLYSCEQFYGANPQAQWWGIINGLVAERAIYADIKAHIHKALSKPINKPIITLVLGSGGMGKSTFLRQLAVDLAQDYKVFWLQDWTSFEAESVADNLAQDSAYQLICLDNWHRLADEDKKSIKKWLEQHSELHSKIKWLLSDREEAKELSDFMYGKSFFDFDDIQNTAKTQDNKLLLTKVADKMTTWKETALELKNHTIANAKPFQILFVLYRWAGREEKIDFEDFETSFHKIVEDDIERLRRDKQIAGFANALIDFAYIFIKYKARLTQNTFLRLADYHNHDSEKIALFANYEQSVPDDEVWGLLRYYLTIFGITSEKQGQEAILDFTKEDLAEAIIEKYAKEFERRKKAVCIFCVKDDSYFSASNLLSSAAIQGIFNSKETIDFVYELLAKGNSYSTYINILTAKNSPLKFDKPEELIEIIEQFIVINPAANIICRYLDMLDKKMAQQKARELLVVENQNPIVINKCFNILGKTKASIAKASELLEQTQDQQITCKCFGILGKTPETQQKATELLEQTQDQQITCICFDILGKTEASIAKASELLEVENQNPILITKCFDILGKTNNTQKKASELLIQENQDKEIVCKCFDILGKTEVTRQKAIELLADENQEYAIICKCFFILGKDEQTKEYARKFLLNSNHETVLAWCVNILEEEARAFALQHLENWKTLDPTRHLLQNCLYVCRNEKKIEEIVAEIIKQKNTLMRYYINVLKVPLCSVPIWQQETTDILHNWKKYSRAFVGASLIGNHNDLSKVKQTCQQILLSWEREISYQQEKGYKVYHFHIFKALSYPSAEDLLYRRLVDMTANAMLEKEKQQAGFLGDMLYEAAYNIVHHQQYPAWIPEEDL